MIRLCEPDISDAEFQAVYEVLKTGYLVQGARVRELEEKIEKYLHVQHAIAVSNGTAALHLALIALKIGPGDEVIVPDFSFPATANVVELVGATPIFIDINLETFNIDTEKIEAKISKNTKAIIPVHEFGLAANLDAINEICEKYDLKIIEDAACALGTCYHKEFVGTKGDIGCFSLHPRKAITTGEGGIIATNKSEIASKLKILRNHGMYVKDNSIDFVLAGFNYRMTDIQGALGNTQMDKLDSIINRRRELANLYFEGLSCNNNLLLPGMSRENGQTYQTYYVILNRKLNRDSVMRELREQGIECNYGAYPLHSLSYYKQKYSYDASEFMNSLFAFGQGIALPLHSRLSDTDIEYVIDKVNLLTQ